METKHFKGGLQNAIRAKSSYIGGYMTSVQMSYEIDYQVTDSSIFAERTKSESDDGIFSLIVGDMAQALSDYLKVLFADSSVNPLEIQEKYDHEAFLATINTVAAQNGYKVISYSPTFGYSEEEKANIEKYIAKKRGEEKKTEEMTVDASTTGTTNSDSFNPLPFIIIGVAVLVIVVIVVIVALKAKKKKQDLPPATPPQTPIASNYPPSTPQTPNFPPSA